MATKRNTNKRLGPLHTCGTSILNIAHKAYKNVEDLPGPLGYVTQNLTTVVGPIIHAKQCYWLMILSSIDDLILTMINMIETLIPQSSYIFNKVDAVVHVSETLAGKFENAVAGNTKVSKMETKRNTNQRLGPLHTCGNSMLKTAHKAYTKAESLPGPMGFTAQKVAKFMGPKIYSKQHHWLEILSITDDRILSVENVIENVFPPSSYIFNKIDTFVQVSETLPGKFEDAVNKFPAMIQRVPCLGWASDKLVQVSETLPGKFDNVVNKFQTLIESVPCLSWALAQLILILNLLVTSFTGKGNEDGENNEKEIGIDINFHDGIANIDNGFSGIEEMMMNITNRGEEEVRKIYKDILNVNEEEEKENTVKEEVESREMKGKREKVTTTNNKTILERVMKKEEEESYGKKQKQNEIQSNVVVKEDQNPIQKLFSTAGWF